MKLRVDYFEGNCKFGSFIDEQDRWGFFLTDVDPQGLRQIEKFKGFVFNLQNDILDLRTRDILNNVLLVSLKDEFKDFALIKLWVQDYVRFVDSICNLSELTHMLRLLSEVFAKDNLNYQKVAQGLFGELIVLRELIPKFGELAVVSAWQNDNSKSLYDIVLTSQEVIFEVKSKVNNDKIVRFDSLDQLSYQGDMSYFLAIVRLSKGTAGSSLRGMIFTLEELLSTSVLPLFKKKLFLASSGLINSLLDYSFEEMAIECFDMTPFKEISIPIELKFGKCSLDLNSQATLELSTILL